MPGTVDVDTTQKYYKITFTNLNYTSKYYVTESDLSGYKAPEYARKVATTSEGDQVITTDSSGKKMSYAEDGDYIINRSIDAVTLPNTGGFGTKIYYMLGLLVLVVAGFGIAVIGNKKKKV